jgi:hypothetical protein
MEINSAAAKAAAMLRLRAALWAAAVAVPPAALAAAQATDTYGYGPWINHPYGVVLLMALGSAAVSGVLLGWRLIDPVRRHNAWSAIFLSVAVAVLAYFLLAFQVTFHTFLSYWQRGTCAEVPDLCSGFADTLFLFWLGSLAFTGWYSLPVACIGGYVLSRRYSREDAAAGNL